MVLTVLFSLLTAVLMLFPQVMFPNSGLNGWTGCRSSSSR